MSLMLGKSIDKGSIKTWIDSCKAAVDSLTPSGKRKGQDMTGLSPTGKPLQKKLKSNTPQTAINIDEATTMEPPPKEVNEGKKETKKDKKEKKSKRASDAIDMLKKQNAEIMRMLASLQPQKKTIVKEGKKEISDEDVSE